MKKLLPVMMFLACINSVWSKAIINPDVQNLLDKASRQVINPDNPSTISVLVFLPSQQAVWPFLRDLNKLPISIKQFESLPVVFITLPANQLILNAIANHPKAMQITSFYGGQEELEYSEQAILLKPSQQYPVISNWWDNGYTGKHSIIGLLDSGVASEHGSLSKKQIIIRKESGSGFDQFQNGVRSAHGTGIACIYAGEGNATFPKDTGIAPNAPIILTALAGEGDGNIEDLTQTFESLDWMLSRSGMKPDVINYSFANGLTNCANCPDWSGLAKVVDYVVNHDHILWVKSAGNRGFVAPTIQKPYAATMTSPADNYNALTVANMNPVIKENGQTILNPNRDNHTIRFTSSRGPTLNGRKKPDISAPGNDTRTCAPNPAVYLFHYTKEMDYHDGYRLMGGTSSAAPHVGAAIVLLHDASITLPIMQKALLINSADAYTDNDKPSPSDPNYTYKGGHYPVMGSQWNRSYGWGYLNMQKAFDERNYLIQDTLTLDMPEKTYEAYLPIGSKITLVHERRVGFSNHLEWRLSHLRLKIIDKDTEQVIMQDDSPQDTVHQVANCERSLNEKLCSPNTKPIYAIIKVTLVSPFIDGAREEPFALASSVALQ